MNILSANSLSFNATVLVINIPDVHEKCSVSAQGPCNIIIYQRKI